MSALSPNLLTLSRQLLDGERGVGDSSTGPEGMLMQACARLRIPLKKLAGTAGYSSLLSRALALATRQVPALDHLRISADGSLTGLQEALPDSARAQVLQDGAALFLAQLLDLLVSFIGQSLTVSLVRETWPEAPIDHAVLEEKEQS